MAHPVAGAAHPRPNARSPGALTGELTPEQREAVRHGHGRPLLVARPGAGKTRTLTHRIAHLLAAGHASPWKILADRAGRQPDQRLLRALRARPALGVRRPHELEVLGRYCPHHAACPGGAGL